MIDVSKNGEFVGQLAPERRLYKASKSNTSNVAIRRRINEDVYLNFAGMTQDGKSAIIQAYVFPLVTCIWAGYWVLLFGTIICLIPSKIRLQYAKTEVVGFARQSAPVKN